MSNLVMLSHLLLDGNRLEELPERFFANASRLTVLDLSGNRLTGEIPSAVNALRNLQSFAIGDNRVESLSRLQLAALWRLRASGNRLSNVSTVQLNGLPALQVQCYGYPLNTILPSPPSLPHHA